jgi:hypothetical protein
LYYLLASPNVEPEVLFEAGVSAAA